jgi:LPS O-antigen subunit length determinant protein (WzzB/FepE family)
MQSIQDTTPEIRSSQSNLPRIPDPDEINLLEYAYALVHRKWWIVGFTFAGLIIGLLAAIAKGPTFVSEAIIAPQESDNQKTPSLAGLGALGGLMASQLSLGGNASLDKIDLILDSRSFSAKLIEKYDLIPFIYKHQNPKAYAKLWDTSSNKWKSSFVAPRPVDMAGLVKSYLKKKINKNNTMSVSVSSKDSAMSFDLASKYLDYLDEFIRSDVQTNAKENVTYLEKQLETISDPLLREKVQALMANEIEKEMIVSKKAFKIIDPVYESKTFKQKKLYPLVFSFGLFFLTALCVVFMHAFSSAPKTDEDRSLIQKIKRELFFSRRRKSV